MLFAGIIQNYWFCALGAVIYTRSPQCFLYADDGWEVSCGASFNAHWDLVSSGESEQFSCLFKVLLLQCYLDLSHSYVELQILEVLSGKCNYLKPAYIINEEVKRFPA